MVLSLQSVFSKMDITGGYGPPSGSSILSGPAIGLLVLMGTHLVCNQKLRVRFSHGPPVLGALANVVIAAA